MVKQVILLNMKRKDLWFMFVAVSVLLLNYYSIEQLTYAIHTFLNCWSDRACKLLAIVAFMIPVTGAFMMAISKDIDKDISTKEIVICRSIGFVLLAIFGGCLCFPLIVHGQCSYNGINLHQGAYDTLIHICGMPSNVIHWTLTSALLVVADFLGIYLSFKRFCEIAMNFL